MTSKYPEDASEKAKQMGDIDNVSSKLGELTAVTSTMSGQINLIFDELKSISGGISTRNEATSVRLKSIEDEHATMKKDIEALTTAIKDLSNAITNAKIKGWKMLALYFAIAATSGGVGAVSGASILKGIFF